MHKLFLLDAMALIYRSHFAFAKTPRISSTGLNTSAVFGFANTLLEILEKERPTHLGVAFDTPKPTFRHERFTAYKAQRQQQPEDISIAIPYVKRLCEAMRIPVLILEGWEADDVIGTLAKRASEAGGFSVFMMTPDKDYGQLVEENIKLYKPAFMGKGVEIQGITEICERWGIENVGQVTDMLGLMGDVSDNIPGIPGIGEKTAQQLVAKYGSVENLIANAHELKGKQAENVVAFAEQGILSKELATIDIFAPIAFEAQALEVESPDTEKLSALLDELEFRTLRRRLLGDAETQVASPQRPSPPSSPGQMNLFGGTSAPALPAEAVVPEETPVPEEKQRIHTTLHDYRLVDTPALRAALVNYLRQQESVCFDTETTNVSAIDAELVGLAFSCRSHEGYFVPVPENQTEAQAIMDEFRVFFEDEKVEKVAQNIKYDLAVLANYGVSVRGPLYDTMLAHYILEPEKRHNMDILAETFLNYSPVSITELIGKKGKNQGTMRDASLEDIKEYAAEDADITLQLKAKLHPILSQNEKFVRLFHDVEMPIAKVLAVVESNGVKLDVDFLGELSRTLDIDQRQAQESIFSLAGQDFNINSPKQLGDILFEKLQLDPKAKKTKTGQYMTGEEVLVLLENKYEIVRKILDYRELQKLKSTYVDVLPTLISPKTGRIHTSFNQAVTSTGRLSSNNPNLQNIPIRTERGREIRRAFIPRNSEFQILSADYSQVELRIMAAFSGDESMIQAFNRGADIHAVTASKVFNVSLDEVTPAMRRKAKTVNFGIIYGVSAFGLSQQVEVSRTEAKELIDGYFREFPAIKTYMDSVITTARDQGFVETVLGRRRYLPNILSGNQTDRGYAERNAINAPIQGSAADLIKMAMIRVHDFLEKEKLKSKLILTVHDELVFDAHESEVAMLKTRVEELMVNALPLAVKMEAGTGIGLNWLEAH